MSSRANGWLPIVAVLITTLAPQPKSNADEIFSPPSTATGATFSHPPGMFALELGIGLNAPLGNFSTAMVFRPLPSIALLAGLGWHQFSDGSSLPFVHSGLRFGLSSRATLFRWNTLSFGLGVGASRGTEREVRTYSGPSAYGDTTLYWTWQQATRLDGEIFLELPVGYGRLGLMAGTGLVLTRPDDRTDAGYDNGTSGDTYAFTPRVFTPYVGVRFSTDFSNPALATDDVLASAKLPRDTDDAASGRAFLSPTALTAPAGSWTIGTVAVVGLGVNYAVTDKLELEADFSPIVDGATVARLKAEVGSPGRLTLAVIAIAGDYGVGIVNAFGAGGVASVCVDTSCRFLLSAYVVLGYGKGRVDDEHFGGGAFLLGPSVLLRLFPHLAAFAETHAITSSRAIGLYNASAGLRFNPTSHWAFEIGATTSIGLPIASITYRTSR